MCGALKTLVCVATVLALAVATTERKKRDDYNSVSSNPWQSPTSYGFRPNNNYYNVPSTRISRVRNYNPYNSGRNVDQSSNLYSAREQNSDWIPITSNSNQQNNGQDWLQRERINAYNTIRAANNQEQRPNGRKVQRQPNYSVQGGGRPINEQILREINAKILAQSNQYPRQPQAYRNGNQGLRPQTYQRQPNGERFNNVYSTRLTPVPIEQGQVLNKNLQGVNQRYPVRQTIQPIGVLDQQSLYEALKTQELPVVEGRILGVNVQPEKPVVEVVQDDVRQNNIPLAAGQIVREIVSRPYGYSNEAEKALNQQRLRLINVEQAIQFNKQTVNEPNVQLQQTLRVINPEELVRSEEIQEPNGEYLRNNIQSNNLVYGRQTIPQPANPQNLALINPNPAYKTIQESSIQEQLIRQQAIQQAGSLKTVAADEASNINLGIPRNQYVSNQVQNNDWRQDAAREQVNNLRNLEGVNINQLQAVEEARNNAWRQEKAREQVGDLRNLGGLNINLLQADDQARNNDWRQEREQEQVVNLGNIGGININQLQNINQARDNVWRQQKQVGGLGNIAGLNINQVQADNQAQNNAWRQEQQGNLRNGLNIDQAQEVNNVATQQGAQNAGNQNVYTYGELTAKIWKVLKSNPTLMSDLDSLREQIMNESNTRNTQIMELRGLLEEARKYNRDAALLSREQNAEQQKRNEFVRNLIDTMNKNEAASSSSAASRQLSFLNGAQNQPRYTVRSTDVNPLIKNILFATKQQSQAENTSTARPTPIVVRPSNSLPLPQLSVAKPFDLQQLEHHYDLTEWKRVTEALSGSPFSGSYDLLKHLV